MAGDTRIFRDWNDVKRYALRPAVGAIPGAAGTALYITGVFGHTGAVVVLAILRWLIPALIGFGAGVIVMYKLGIRRR